MAVPGGICFIIPPRPSPFLDFPFCSVFRIYKVVALSGAFFRYSHLWLFYGFRIGSDRVIFSLWLLFPLSVRASARVLSLRSSGGKVRGSRMLHTRMPLSEAFLGLQIRGSKFQSLNSNSRELELTNLLGLVLGCIEAKFCK